MGDVDESTLIQSISTSDRINRDRGKDVRKQLEIYGKIIELRLALFDAHNLSNELPVHPVYSDLLRLDSGAQGGELKETIDSVNEEIRSLIKKLLELEENLIKLNDGLCSKFEEEDVKDKSGLTLNFDESVSRIDKVLDEWRADCIRKAWEESIVSRLGASALKLTSIRGDSYTLIERSLDLDLDELIKTTKIDKTKIKVIGDIEDEDEFSTEPSNLQSTLPDTYDDTSTYNQLTRSFLELQKYVTSDPSSINIIDLSKHLRKKLKCNGSVTRSNKEKRIRYAVHDKISNFMAPRPRPKNYLEQEAARSLLSALFSR